MRILCVGGGPAGLYFSILMKKSDPAHEITVVERNRRDDTFGFGVVFSDATLDNLARADAESCSEVTRHFAHWDSIDIHYRGQVVRSTGHGFAGLGRHALLDVLQRRCESLGVELRFGEELPDAPAGHDLVLACDGVNSVLRARHAAAFHPSVDHRPNRFVWLGTTFPFPAFTFYFNENEHGLWRVHAYRYAEGKSTFIVECTEDTWRRAAMDRASEDDTIAYLERVFARELGGHRLIKNRSLWRQFPTVRNGCWHDGNMVLCGDAAHTAHFSIGSGTKLAMEDAIALHDAIHRERDVPAALAAYERERRPVVESTQRAAQVSLEWFEATERFMKLEPLQFATSLLTRSLRVTHANLALRDPAFVTAAGRWFAGRAAAQCGREPGPAVALAPPPPPMFTPFRARELVLENRVVVSPMCQYSAADGTPGDWHLVHLGSRAMGGAALVIAEATHVTREGRITPGCAGMYKPEHVDAWRRIVDFVHAHTPAKIGLQLAHAGRKAATCIPWKGGGNRPLPEGAWPLMAASAVAYSPAHQVPREMTRADMDDAVAAFARAARMADEAGFDWLEIHAAHGYLLSSFISPLTNLRKDEYGGSVESRMRFPVEVARAVREAWPAARPLSVRISASDWAPGGLTPEDTVVVARLFHEAGCDLIDVSSGGTVAEARPAHGRLYQTPFADRIRQEAGVPTMTVGTIQSVEDVNSILLAGRADLVVMARHHLYDPYFTRHAAAEQGVSLPWPAPYATLDKYVPRAARR